MSYHLMPCHRGGFFLFCGGVGGGAVGWLATRLLEKQNIKTIEKVVNAMEAIKANSLDSYLIIISTL